MWNEKVKEWISFFLCPLSQQCCSLGIHLALMQRQVKIQRLNVETVNIRDRIGPRTTSERTVAARAATRVADDELGWHMNRSSVEARRLCQHWLICEPFGQVCIQRRRYTVEASAQKWLCRGLLPVRHPLAVCSAWLNLCNAHDFIVCCALHDAISRSTERTNIRTSTENGGTVINYLKLDLVHSTYCHYMQL